MKVQKYFMRTRMHGTPTRRPDYRCLVLEQHGALARKFSYTRAGKGPAAPLYSAGLSVVLGPGHGSSALGNSWRQIPLDMENLARTPLILYRECWGSKADREHAHRIHFCTPYGFCKNSENFSRVVIAA